MSPIRKDPRRASARLGPSPYAYAYTQSSGPTTESRGAPSDGFVDSSPVPSYEQYKQLEANYLGRMDAHSRQRVLISQGMFNRIWNILLGVPKNMNHGARFPRWVHNTFSIDGDYAPTGLNESGARVLSHKGRIVVTQDRIYGLLCYAHQATDHGGRDKMLFLIHQRYTWVPKALITAFIAACPTCAKERNGGRSRICVPKPSNLELQSSIAFETTCQITSTIRNSTHLETGLSRPTAPATIESNPLSFTTFMTTPAMTRGSSSSSLGSHGMSREVSLYQGLPNGWQFHSDYAAAHSAFLDAKNYETGNHFRSRLRVTKPRIPSIAPIMMEPNQNQDGSGGSISNTVEISTTTLSYIRLQEPSVIAFSIPRQIDPQLPSTHTGPSSFKTIIQSTISSRTCYDFPHREYPNLAGQSNGDSGGRIQRVPPPSPTLDIETMMSRHSLQDMDSAPMSATSSRSSEAAPRTPADEPTIATFDKHFQSITEPQLQSMMDFRPRF